MEKYASLMERPIILCMAADVGSFSLNAQYTLSSDGNWFQSNTLVFRQETYCQNVIVQNHNIIIFYFISVLPK